MGLVSGTCFADLGVNVTCVDRDSQKINRLVYGAIPIYEPGLDNMINRNVTDKRLTFSSDYKQGFIDQDYVFCAIDTTASEDGSTDLTPILDIAKDFGESITRYSVFVIKSTVPVGTAQHVTKIITETLEARGAQDIKFDVASNPDFLTEGNGIKDFMKPDRIVIGTETLFEIVGADINVVRHGVGSDSRIGPKYIFPGCGYGGTLFPQDINDLIKIGSEHNFDMEILKAVENVNTRQKRILFKKLNNHFKGNLEGKTVALWGLSFKPETDDMTAAPAIDTINLLMEAGCHVRVYDPVAMNATKRRWSNVYCGLDMYDAVKGADAVLLLTEWRQFRIPAWQTVKKLMKTPLVIDGRNVYDGNELEQLGFTYYCIGR